MNYSSSSPSQPHHPAPRTTTRRWVFEHAMPPLIADYAEGLLDDDPQSKEVIEAIIAQSPEARTMLEDCLAIPVSRTPEEWDAMADRILAKVHASDPIKAKHPQGWWRNLWRGLRTACTVADEGFERTGEGLTARLEFLPRALAGLSMAFGRPVALAGGLKDGALSPQADAIPDAPVEPEALFEAWLKRLESEPDARPDHAKLVVNDGSTLILSKTADGTWQVKAKSAASRETQEFVICLSDGSRLASESKALPLAALLEAIEISVSLPEPTATRTSLRLEFPGR
jgi:hypothetical protein